MIINNVTQVFLNNNCYTGDTVLNSIDLYNVPWTNNTMAGAFNGCTNLKSVTHINNNVRNMIQAFKSCEVLPNCPTIPNSVRNMFAAFAECNSLTDINLNVSANNMSLTFLNCRNLRKANITALNVDNANGIFSGCNNVTDVNTTFKKGCNMNQAFIHCNSLKNISAFPQNIIALCSTFWQCKSLVSSKLPTIPDSVINMTSTFSQCTNAGFNTPPAIPNSVTTMTNTFYGCNELLSPPVIPNSVTHMNCTFWGCTRLQHVPVIPDSVIHMSKTFIFCNSITEMPNIPSNVADMEGTFKGCENVEGNIYIHSNKITNAINCFYDTTATKVKNVYIPFKYSNGVISATYNSFTTAGYDTQGTQNGVYLKDINGPSYATQIPMYKFTATGSGDLYFIGEYSINAVHHTGLDVVPIDTITGTLGQTGSVINVTCNGTTSTLSYVETKSLSNNVTLYVYGQNDSSLPGIKVCVIPESVVGDYVTFGVKWANASNMTSSSVYYLDRTYSKATYSKAFTKAGLVDI